MTEIQIGDAPTPGVILAFRVFVVVFALMYLAVMALGGVFLIFGDELDLEPGEGFITAAMLLVVGAPLFFAYVIALVLPRKPWVWIYDLILISLGLTSCLTLPFALPLLLYWLKPPAKAWFGRAD